MADILPPSPVDAPFGSYNWQDWYVKVRNAINSAATISWSQITDFTGSNLNQIATRNFNQLQGIPTNSATITLAKITVGGTNGSITILNGLITAFVSPT